MARKKSRFTICRKCKHGYPRGKRLAHRLHDCLDKKEAARIGRATKAVQRETRMSKIKGLTKKSKAALSLLDKWTKEDLAAGKAPVVGSDGSRESVHYGGADNPHETVKCLEAWGLESDALLWTAAKYISRAGKKDGESPLKDLKKALFYLKRRVENLEKRR